MNLRCLSIENYQVAWITALPEELGAATALLDETHSTPKNLPVEDENGYTYGCMFSYDVVIASLPAGVIGTNSVAGVANGILRTFPNVKVGLMVGVAGGAPSLKNDIGLGDVVVSCPSDGTGGVLQYDLGRSVQDEDFKVTGYLAPPPRSLLNALASIRGQNLITGDMLRDLVHATDCKNHRRRIFETPDPESDLLFRSSFIHRAEHRSCMQVCRQYTDMLAERAENLDRVDNEPFIHYGTIASGNQLIRDAKMRNKIARERNVLCFEMEASGLMTSYPCLVIRGISDYADTHKNDTWKYYAAANAAAYAKLLLQHVRGLQEEPRNPIARGDVEVDRRFLKGSRSRSDTDRLPLALEAVTLDESRSLRSGSSKSSRNLWERDNDHVYVSSSQQARRQGEDMSFPFRKNGRGSYDGLKEHNSSTEGAMVRYENDLCERLARTDQLVRCQAYYLILNNAGSLRQWLVSDGVMQSFGGNGCRRSARVMDLIWLLAVRYFQSSWKMRHCVVRLDVGMLEPCRNDEEAERAAWLSLTKQLERNLAQHHPRSRLLGGSTVRDDRGKMAVIERFAQLIDDEVWSARRLVFIINLHQRDMYSRPNLWQDLVTRMLWFAHVEYAPEGKGCIQPLGRYKMFVTSHAPGSWNPFEPDNHIYYHEATFGPTWDSSIEALDKKFREVLRNYQESPVTMHWLMLA